LILILYETTEKLMSSDCSGLKATEETEID